MPSDQSTGHDAEIERLRLASKAGGEAYDAGRPCDPPEGDVSSRRCWIGGWHFAKRQGLGQTPVTRRRG